MIPKRRFKLNNSFRIDGTTWKIIAMYRVVSEPHIWYHVLEEIGERTHPHFDGEAKGSVTESCFKNHNEAWNSKIQYIYACGDRIVQSTQELLKHSKSKQFAK